MKEVKRRRYGAGTVTKLASGRFRAQVRLPTGARVGETFDTEEEAERFRAALAVERNDAAKRGEFAPKREEPAPLTGLVLEPQGEGVGDGFHTRVRQEARPDDRTPSKCLDTSAFLRSVCVTRLTNAVAYEGETPSGEANPVVGGAR